MSCPTCEICGDDNGFLRCRHVGPICFDCWGSGIHDAMVRKNSCWEDFLNHVLRDLVIGLGEGTFRERGLRYGIRFSRRFPSRFSKESIVTDGVAS